LVQHHQRRALDVVGGRRAASPTRLFHIRVAFVSKSPPYPNHKRPIRFVGSILPLTQRLTVETLTPRIPASWSRLFLQPRVGSGLSWDMAHASGTLKAAYGDVGSYAVLSTVAHHRASEPPHPEQDRCASCAKHM
jgi:hypothetical protein